jgi:predicted PurR-regulated permease PerM
MSSSRERLRLIPGQGRDDLSLFVSKLFIAVAFGLVLIVLWRVRHVLTLILIAAVIAAGIAPAVRRVQIRGRFHLRRRIARGTAAVIVYFPFLFLVALLAALTIPALMVDTRDLFRELPPLIDQKLLKPLERYVEVNQARTFLYEKGRDALAELPILGYLKGAAGVIASVVAVLFMVIYMLIDADRLRNLFLLFYPAHERSDKRRVIDRMGRRMSSWLSAQLLLAGIIGVTTFVVLLLLRIPYALPLALVAAVGEMVPVIGPVLGAVPALAVAMFQSPVQFWAVLLMAILIQQVENYFLVPRLMAKKVAVSPLGVFIAFMMGASLLGIIGAMLAVPMAAVVQVAFEEGFLRQRERRQDTERAGTLARSNDDE